MWPAGTCATLSFDQPCLYQGVWAPSVQSSIAVLVPTRRLNPQHQRFSPERRRAVHNKIHKCVFEKMPSRWTFTDLHGWARNCVKGRLLSDGAQRMSASQQYAKPENRPPPPIQPFLSLWPIGETNVHKRFREDVRHEPAGKPNIACLTGRLTGSNRVVNSWDC